MFETALPHDAVPVRLPKPRQSGGKPLLDVLSQRKSARHFAVTALTQQLLSDLLWAGFGLSGKHLEHRTAPSARNWRETDIYVVLPKGAFRFDPIAEGLEPVSTRDLRIETGQQDFVATAPLTLVYVANHDKMAPATQEEKIFFSAFDVGAISENVCLFCASEGLATVIRTSMDRLVLSQGLALRETQHIVAAQSVGYPAN